MKREEFDAVIEKMHEINEIGHRIVTRAANVNKKGLEKGSNWGNAVLEVMTKYNMSSEDIGKIDQLSSSMNTIVREFGEVMIEASDNHLDMLSILMEFVENIPWDDPKIISE